MRKKWRVIFTLGFIFLSIIPIIGIFFITNKELDNYKIEVTYDMNEKAYGEMIKPVRGDIKEYYYFDGEVVSDTIRNIKIPECDYSKLRFDVEVGDEIYTGEKIGYSDDVIVYSSCDGLVKEIDVTSEKPVIRVNTFDNLILKVVVPVEKLMYIQNIMFDENNNKLTLINKSRQYIDNGVYVKFKIENGENYRFGQKLEKIKLFTGKVYKNVLMLPEKCVYQKDNTEDFFVRICDGQGNVINEQEVEIGLKSNNYVSVVGITEKDYCDSGYSSVINGKDISNDEEYVENSEE